jgi:hypothetical protein
MTLLPIGTSSLVIVGKDTTSLQRLSGEAAGSPMLKCVRGLPAAMGKSDHLRSLRSLQGG